MSSFEDIDTGPKNDDLKVVREDIDTPSGTTPDSKIEESSKSEVSDQIAELHSGIQRRVSN